MVVQMLEIFPFYELTWSSKYIVYYTVLCAVSRVCVSLTQDMLRCRLLLARDLCVYVPDISCEQHR